MHLSSYRNMEKFVNRYLAAYRDEKLEILDVGSQDVNGSYRPLFVNPNWHYAGLDIVEGDNVDIVIKSIYDWCDLKSNRYDVVISGQAFEHIEYFWVTMSEIARVLKQEGWCCLVAPSSGEEHRYPVDCWRFYADGMKALARYAGLQKVEVYTQYSRDVYPDYDPMWKDSVLICRKPRITLSRTITCHIRNRLIVFAERFFGDKR